MTLLEFLEARLAEDEAMARAATPGPWTVDNEIYAESISSDNGTDVVSGGRWGGEASVFQETEDALHIGRHDPARVLAEVEMKRYLIRLHAPHEVDGPVMRINGKDQVVLNTNCRSCSDRNPPTWPCATLKALVKPYAGHPDCPPELAVSAWS